MRKTKSLLALPFPEQFDQRNQIRLEYRQISAMPRNIMIIHAKPHQHQIRTFDCANFSTGKLNLQIVGKLLSELEFICISLAGRRRSQF
jgi:hypothetical protein